jgi:hypothetical protein
MFCWNGLFVRIPIAERLDRIPTMLPMPGEGHKDSQHKDKDQQQKMGPSQAVVLVFIHNRFPSARMPGPQMPPLRKAGPQKTFGPL